jgi:hypothetical protein
MPQTQWWFNTNHTLSWLSEKSNYGSYRENGQPFYRSLGWWSYQILFRTNYDGFT